MSIQSQMQSKLASLSIPSKDIQVYGRQIVITSHCRDTADKWAQTLTLFAKVRGITESFDYAKENKGTCLLPTVVKVWRTFATIGQTTDG